MILVKSKAQSWSLDITLAVIVFIITFLVVYGLLNESPNSKIGALRDEASIILQQIVSSDAPYRIIDSNEVNVSKLNQLKNISYDELRSVLRIEGDFCIFMEDDKGSLVLMNNSYVGVGSPNIILSGVPCSQK